MTYKCAFCGCERPIVLEVIPVEEPIENFVAKKFRIKVGFCQNCKNVYVCEIIPE